MNRAKPNRSGNGESSRQPNRPKPPNPESLSPRPDSLTSPGDAGSESTAAETFEEAAAEAGAIPVEEAAPAAPTVEAGAPPEPENAEAIKRGASMFVAEMVPFGVLAQFRVVGVGGPHWRITKDQAEALAPLWCNLLDKYIPGWWTDIGPEAQLFVVLAPLIMAKYQQDREAAASSPKPAETPPGVEYRPNTAGGRWEGGPTAAPPG